MSSLTCLYLKKIFFPQIWPLTLTLIDYVRGLVPNCHYLSIKALQFWKFYNKVHGDDVPTL